MRAHVTGVRCGDRPPAAYYIGTPDSWRGSEDRVVKPVTQSLEAGGGKVIFDFSAFAPTEDVTLELGGRATTRTCLLPRAVLTLFR